MLLLLLTMSGSRQKRPTWIIILLVVSFVSFFLLFTFGYSSWSSAWRGNQSLGCLVNSGGCSGTLFPKPLFSPPLRDLSDAELASEAVLREILRTPLVRSPRPKVAFMFLTPGSLPFEKLWDKFFDGHGDKFTVYVHASKEKPRHVSPYFVDRNIHSAKLKWGRFSMIEAEKRLLASALLDPDNQHFVLLSDSCVPVRNFEYVYNYLIFTNISFLDCFVDPGPHGNERYSNHMLPEIEKKDFQKGSQWFSLTRKHATLVMADYLYHAKFKFYCKPNMEGRNCYSDEHYFQTFFHVSSLKDPQGIANWSVTHVDWSEGKWHPKAYRSQDVTFELLKNITFIDESTHVTSDAARTVTTKPCLWNGAKRPCYLFARKFYPETLDKLIQLFSNYAQA